jgi:hypothetical protein
MRRSELLFILFHVILKFWRFIFWKTQKYMMSSCMTKLEFSPKPYMLFRLGKLPYICCLLLYWVLSSFVDPYERFFMLLKSRSRTHHPHMHYSYTGDRCKTHAFYLDLSKNVLLLHWEWTENMFVRFPCTK